MCPPGVAEAPGAVPVAVEDADLAVDGAGRAAVAVGVEGHCLDEVLVAVLQVEAKVGLFVDERRRVGQRRGHGALSSPCGREDAGEREGRGGASGA